MRRQRLVIAVAVIAVGCSTDDSSKVQNTDTAAMAMSNPALMFHVADVVHELGLDARATQIAQASGSWNNCATWDVPGSTTCAVPSDGAIVIIPAGLTVTVDRDQPALVAAVVVRGTLRFAPDRTTRLRVDTLFIDDGASLVIGTPANPVGTGNVTAHLVFPGDSRAFGPARDPRQVTHGLVSNGTITMAGRFKKPFVYLARNARSGDRQLYVAAPPAGWSIGDQLVVPATQFDLDFTSTQNEVVTIHDIQPACTTDGLTCVVLDSGLAYDHRTPSTSAPTGVPAMQIPVANLDRDIVVETVPAPHSVALRGHVMLMTNAASISGTAFLDLGRTDKHVPVVDPTYDASTHIIHPGTNPRARYSLHFHEAGDSQADLARPALVDDSVMRGSPGWGFVNHGSTVKFHRNVAFDFVGAGFVTEDGDEAGEFVANLAIGGRSTSSGPDIADSSDLPPESMKVAREVFGNAPRLGIGDMGFGGHGFWFQGPDIRVVQNIACGNKGAGFVWWADGKYDPPTTNYTGFPLDRLPSPFTGQTFAFPPHEANINQVGIREFRDNQSFANFIGLKIRFTNGFGGAPMGLPSHDFKSDLVGQPSYGTSLIQSSTLWYNWVGAISSYTQMHYRDVFILGPPAALQPPDRAHWKAYQPSTGVYIRGPHVLDFESNVTIRGYNVGAFDTLCDLEGSSDNASTDASGLRIDGAIVVPSRLPPCDGSAPRQVAGDSADE